MRRAILLTGFSNWGKTWHVYDLFAGRRRFDYGKTYAIPGVNAAFTVESHSNDDYNQLDYIETIKKRLNNAPKAERDLFSVLYPTREPNNNSHSILSGNPFSKFDEIHLILLECKWDLHAKLQIPAIERYLTLPNVIHFRATANQGAQRSAQIVRYLKSLYRGRS